MSPRNIHEDITQTIGNTPIVRLKKFETNGVKLYAKVEATNPGGSVKDRMALAVIEDAERKGLLKPGQTVIEATSGNTGIGLAVVCAQKGYPLVIVMAESFSVERRKLLRFLGAKVVLTPAAEKGTGMVRKAKELAEAHGWFLCRQFENEANADAHSRTTAREILRDFHGDRLDYFVSGYGTGGTLKGVSRALKAERLDIQIIAAEPDNSALLASGTDQVRADDGSAAASHPAFRPHVVQGWTADFIPKLTEDAIEYIDRLAPVSGLDALDASRRLARECGILAGISSGATLAAAIEVAQHAKPGSTVLCMLPDTGERYQSTVLFEDIQADMNEAEAAISRSTETARFDAPSSPPPAVNSNILTPDADAEADQFIEQITTDTSKPIIMFAMEWCEFCWSVRRLIKDLGLTYHSVDVDSAKMQEGNWGGRIRAALTRKTGSKTVPQIFIGGEFIGGATDILARHDDGSLVDLLKATGLAIPPGCAAPAREYLPKWLHKRSA